MSTSSSGSITPSSESGYFSANDYEEEIASLPYGRLQMDFLEVSPQSHMELEYLPKENSTIGFYLDVGGGRGVPIHYKKEHNSQKEAIDKARLINTFMSEIEDFYHDVVLEKYPELEVFGFSSDNFVKYHLKTGLLILAFGEGDDRTEYRFHMGESKSEFSSINHMYLYLNAHTEVSTSNMPQFSIYSKAPINAPLSILENPDKQTERLQEKVRYTYHHEIDYWDSAEHNEFCERLSGSGRLPVNKHRRFAEKLAFGQELQERLLEELDGLLEAAQEAANLSNKELESIEQMKTFRNRVQNLDLFAITSAMALKIGIKEPTCESAKEDLAALKGYIASIRLDGVKGVVSRIPLLRDQFDLGSQLSSVEEDYAKAIVGMTIEDPLAYHDFMQGKMRRDSLEEGFFHMVMHRELGVGLYNALSGVNSDARREIEQTLTHLLAQMRGSSTPRGSEIEISSPHSQRAYLAELSPSRRESVENSPRFSSAASTPRDASIDRGSSRWPHGIRPANIAAGFSISDVDEMEDLYPLGGFSPVSFDDRL